MTFSTYSYLYLNQNRNLANQLNGLIGESDDGGNKITIMPGKHKDPTIILHSST